MGFMQTSTLMTRLCCLIVWKRRSEYAEGGREMFKALSKLVIAFFLLGIFRVIVGNWVTEWPTTICFGLIVAGFVANSQ